MTSRGIFKVTTGNGSQQSCGLLDPVATNKSHKTFYTSSELFFYE